MAVEMDAPTMDVLRKQAIAMSMLWLTARNYQHEGGLAWFHIRARDLGLREDVLAGKRIRVTIDCGPDLHDDAPVLQCSACGRKSWDQGEHGRFCNMSQPSNRRCSGIMCSPVSGVKVCGCLSVANCHSPGTAQCGNVTPGVAVDRCSRAAGHHFENGECVYCLAADPAFGVPACDREQP